MEIDSLLNLKTKVEEKGSKKILVISFSGKITSDNIVELNRRVKSIFEDNIYNVILNISDLGYVNSTGIAMFLSISKTIEQNSGKIILTKPSPFVEELFKMTDLITRFQIANSMEEALAEFSD